MSIGVLIALGLAGLWMLVVGEVSAGQLVLGILFGAAFVWYSQVGRLGTVQVATLPRRLYWLAYLLLVLLPLDLVRSSVDVAVRSRPGRGTFRPGIVRYELPLCSPYVSTLISHAITIAPGEALVDASPDQCVLYIHVVDATRVSRRIRVWNQYLRVLLEVLE